MLVIMQYEQLARGIDHRAEEFLVLSQSYAWRHFRVLGSTLGKLTDNDVLPEPINGCHPICISVRLRRV